MLMSLWVYTTPSLWPIEDSYEFRVNTLSAAGSVDQISIEWYFNEDQAYIKRLFKNLYLTLAIASIIAIALAESYLKVIFAAINKVCYYLFCCCLCNKKNKVSSIDEKAGMYGEYHAEYENLKTAGSTTYKIRENK